jgi:hypothetical protein
VLCNGTVPAWLSTVPAVAHRLERVERDEGVHEDHPRRHPDAGSHVQYFYRKSHSIDPFLNYRHVPGHELHHAAVA